MAQISSAPVGSRKYLEDVANFNEPAGSSYAPGNSRQQYLTTMAKGFGYDYNDPNADVAIGSDAQRKGGGSSWNVNNPGGIGPSPAVLGDPSMPPPTTGIPPGPSGVINSGGTNTPTSSPTTSPIGPSPATLGNMLPTPPTPQTTLSGNPIINGVPPIVKPNANPANPINPVNPATTQRTPPMMNNPLANKRMLQNFGGIQ